MKDAKQPGTMPVKAGGGSQASWMYMLAVKNSTCQNRPPLASSPLTLCSASGERDICWHSLTGSLPPWLLGPGVLCALAPWEQLIKQGLF